jgi:ASC-1-like (ASCH) protein/thiamine kinase-like enzyme
MIYAKVLNGSEKISLILLMYAARMSKQSDDLKGFSKMKRHVMNLTPAPLKMIRECRKTIELRLYDEKRKQVSIGDIITFVNTEDKDDELTARVTDLYVFGTFEELYENLPLLECGYTEDDIDSASPADMELYYPKDKQKLYGVVGIKLSLDVKEIKKGQSGAEVYDINGVRIFKHVKREQIENGKFDTYKREALLYRSLCPNPFLPEIQDIEISDDEISLVMKKYRDIEKENISNELIRKIATVLADIHTTEIPEFLLSSRNNPDTLSDEEIKNCVDGWKGVLGEHPGEFDDSLLKEISEKINSIISWHNSEDKVLSHGDFHWENLLTDETGEIKVCDWQGVNVDGESADISFLFSRLGADGVSIDPELFLKYYSGELERKKGTGTEIKEIERHIKASNVITTFRFWHYYLHGNPVERVREIYGKMVEDYNEVGFLYKLEDT